MRSYFLVYIGLAFYSKITNCYLGVLGWLICQTFIYLANLFKKHRKASIHLFASGTPFQSYLIQAVNNFKYVEGYNYSSDYKNKIEERNDKMELNQRRIGIYGSIMK